MATHATVWFGVLSTAVATLAAGTAVVSDGTGMVPATAANRTAYGRAVGIALAAADTENPTFEYQVAGIVSTALTGLGAGAASWVRVSASGTLERVTTPAAGDDIVGRCNAVGDLYTLCGILGDFVNGGGGGGSATPGGADTTVQYNNAGALGGATNVKIAGGDLVVGTGTPAAGGAVRMGVNDSWRVRDFANAQDIGVVEFQDNGTTQELFFGSYGDGASAKTVKRLSFAARDLVYMYLDNVATPMQWSKIGTGTYATFVTNGFNFAIGGSTAMVEGDFGGGAGVFYWGNANAAPTTNPSGGIIAYVAGGVLKYRKTDGTIITLDGSGGVPGGSANEVQVNDGAGGFAGATNVKAGADYLSFGNAPATAGTLRFTDGGSLRWRDAGNTTDLNFLTVSSGVSTFGHTTVSQNIGGSSINLTSQGSFGLAVANGTGAVSSMQFYGNSQDFISFGAGAALARPTDGHVRFVYTGTNTKLMSTMWSDDATEYGFFNRSGDNFGFGGGNYWASLTLDSQSTFLWGRTAAGIYNVSGSGYGLYLDATVLYAGKPRLGGGVLSGNHEPYASEGRRVLTDVQTGDTNYTLSAVDTARRIIRFNVSGALGTATYTFPHPASEEDSYEKIIHFTTAAYGCIITTGTGTTETLPGTGTSTGVFIFTPDGVKKVAS